MKLLKAITLAEDNHQYTLRLLSKLNQHYNYPTDKYGFIKLIIELAFDFDTCNKTQRYFSRCNNLAEITTFYIVCRKQNIIILCLFDLILKNAPRCNTKKNLRPRVRIRGLLFFPKNSWDSKHVLQFILFPESIRNSKHVVKSCEARSTLRTQGIRFVFAGKRDILLLDRRSSCSGRLWARCGRGGGRQRVHAVQV